MRWFPRLFAARSTVLRGRVQVAWLFGAIIVTAAGVLAHVPPLSSGVLTRDEIWRGIFARPAPGDIPGLTNVSAARIALGKSLFHDVRLSGGGQRACASCHDPAKGFSNGAARGISLDGTPLKRNVLSLYNVAWGKSFYWDGRAPSLEEQARSPILAPGEMAADFPTIVARLAADGELATRFREVFPGKPEISEANILSALAAFERSLVSPLSRFDRWVAGDDGALSKAELRGFDIFVGKGGCVACHGGWRFSDDAFHDIGLKSDDPGRGAVTGGVPGLAQFKTPGLRELLSTGPYMHDGSLATLHDVVAHYADNVQPRPSLAANIRRDLSLSEAERDDLVAFLRSLSATP